MKILFICSSLEPKEDGVGDYTRKLAQAVINRGHAARIIAINDRKLKGNSWKGTQNGEDIEIDVLRLSSSINWRLRLSIAKKFVENFSPDWISLQFVPFGYQLKGLPFKLDKKLKYLSEHVRWHVMFHELSVNKNESIKFRIWAFLQISIIRSLLKRLKPSLITTNTEVYQHSLKKIGYLSYVLPLFSNIKRGNFSSEDYFLHQIPDYLQTNRGSFLIGTLFGNFAFKSWNLHSLLKKLLNQYPDHTIIIASIGKMSSGDEYWQILKDQYPSINFLKLGIRDADFISFWLSFYTDFGILTTLPELSGKSGSFMAFKEHGIPVVCRELYGQLSSGNIKLDDALVIVADDNKPLNIPEKSDPVSLLENTVEQFINILK